MILAVLLDDPVTAYAGMPAVLLSDLARMRFQTISFFMLVLLVCSLIIQKIWNSLGRDFPNIPRLDFKRAVGLVIIWGFLFVLVLTMISGARELMTPGAWKKQGFTYTLAEDAESPERAQENVPAKKPDASAESGDNDASRRETLDRLRVALWKYAITHDGCFPAFAAEPEIPERAWRTADPSGLHFVYRPGLKADERALPLAYEPGPFGPDRWILLTDGTLKKLPISTIKTMTGNHEAPAKDGTTSTRPGAAGP